MSQKKGKDTVKKVLIIISGLAFLLFSGSAVIRMILNPQTPSTNTQTSQVNDSPEERLKQQAKGYEIVLEKEPNNRFALEKLVEVNLQLGNLQGAMPLMEKLVENYPDNERYQEVLTIINQGIEQQKNLSSFPQNSNSNPNPEQPNSP